MKTTDVGAAAARCGPVVAPAVRWLPAPRLGGSHLFSVDEADSSLGRPVLIQAVAPCVFDGLINGQCFRAYVERQLYLFSNRATSS